MAGLASKKALRAFDLGRLLNLRLIRSDLMTSIIWARCLLGDPPKWWFSSWFPFQTQPTFRPQLWSWHALEEPGVIGQELSALALLLRLRVVALDDHAHLQRASPKNPHGRSGPQGHGTQKFVRFHADWEGCLGNCSELVLFFTSTRHHEARGALRFGMLQMLGLCGL